MIPLFTVICYKDGQRMLSEICVNIMEAEQRAKEFKEFDRFDKIRILMPGENDDQD